MAGSWQYAIGNIQTPETKSTYLQNGVKVFFLIFRLIEYLDISANKKSMLEHNQNILNLTIKTRVSFLLDKFLLLLAYGIRRCLSQINLNYELIIDFGFTIIHDCATY